MMKEDRPLTRRDFIRGTACAGMGVALGMARGQGAPSRSPGQKSRVVVVRNAEALGADNRARADVVEQMLSDGIRAFAGTATAAEAWKRFFRPDDIVAIKSNVMMTPTHPEVVRAIMKGIASAGVADEHIRVWDRNRGGIGLAQAAPSAWKWRPGFGRDSVSLAVAQSTALVNVPGLKSHWLSGLAGALKNWAGAVTRINVSDRNAAFAFHGDSCADTGKLNAIPAIRKKCRLIVVDALRPLCHGGPQVDPRYLWPYKGLVIGTDPVAVDAVCLRILQGRRNKIRGRAWPLSPPPKHVAVAAEKYKLGTADPARIEVVRLGWDEDAFV